MHLEQVDNSIKNNPKSFWGHVNKERKTNTTPSILHYQDNSFKEPSEISHAFANYFSTVFKGANGDPPAYSYPEHKVVTSWHLSAVDIERRLNMLDHNKGAGPDSIPPMVLKFCSPVISPFLATYFNLFFSCGTFPNILKSGYIVPIFKSGDRSNPTNYRPVVILNTLSKVFESLVLDGLEFEFKLLIAPQQHGFRSGRSTTTNLTIFQHYVTSAFVRGHQVDCIYLDFTKAFDQVSHKHLLAKMDALGISGSLLHFLESYLRGRSLRVRCGSEVSFPITVSSGVPQGSHLGPFLFNLFVNDFGKDLGVGCLLFADDAKLFLEITSDQDVYQLQSSLRLVEEWCLGNSMNLNTSKCMVMTFTRSQLPQVHNYYLGNELLHRVERTKDLGVIMTPTLHPGEHIHYICRKANSTLGFIFRFTRGLSTVSLVTLFKALVRPLLEYNSPVWSPYQDGLISALEGVQVRFIRVVGCRMGYRYLDVPIPLLRNQFNLLSLVTRRKIFDSVFLKKLLNGIVDCPEILREIHLHVPRRTRSLDTFERLHYNTTYQQRSTLPRLLSLGNEVGTSVDLFSSSVASFRSRTTILFTTTENH